MPPAKVKCLGKREHRAAYAPERGKKGEKPFKSRCPLSWEALHFGGGGGGGVGGKNSPASHSAYQSKREGTFYSSEGENRWGPRTIGRKRKRKGFEMALRPSKPRGHLPSLLGKPADALICRKREKKGKQKGERLLAVNVCTRGGLNRHLEEKDSEHPKLLLYEELVLKRGLRAGGVVVGEDDMFQKGGGTGSYMEKKGKDRSGPGSSRARCTGKDTGSLGKKKGGESPYARKKSEGKGEDTFIERTDERMKKVPNTGWGTRTSTGERKKKKGGNAVRLKLRNVLPW